MAIKIKPDLGKIKAKITAGTQAMKIAVTESVVEYGNIFVREDQGTLKDSALIASRPQEGKAVWDTPYAKRVYYTGTPSKDKNPDASLPSSSAMAAKRCRSSIRYRRWKSRV